ncbi:MAG: ABC transporter permease, partial [Armatimonadota bacterium]
TQNDILFEYAEYGILAAGMTLVIIAAGIDLSVGSVLGFSATLFSLLLIGYGWSAPAAIALTVSAGAAMGATNGLIIARFRMQPFVATLGMMLVARGAAKWISGGIKVQPGAREWYALQSGNPPVFDWMTSQTALLGLRPITVAFIVAILVLWVVLRFTRFGRHLYAIGGNEEAARLSGIRVGAVKIAAYTLCGFTAGLAGVCNAGRVTLGDPGEAGLTYELDAIAAVVIGGTSLMGGKGGMFFTFLGTLIIAYISKILSLQGIEEAPRLMIRGALIVIAVLIQQSRKE